MDAAVIDQALDLVADGYGIRTVARKTGIRRSTLWDTLESAEYAGRYARARQRQADTIADMIMQIVKHCLAGKLDPNAARVAIDGIKWQASKLKPQVYGDKLALTGADGGPIALTVLDDAELARRVALLLSHAPGAQIEGEATHEPDGA